MENSQSFPEAEQNALDEQILAAENEGFALSNGPHFGSSAFPSEPTPSGKGFQDDSFFLPNGL